MIPPATRAVLLQAVEVVLDANVALLLVVGRTDPSQVGRHKRTSDYTPTDYLLIGHIAKSAKRLCTTPHVLAEVSNLLGDWPEARSTLLSVFRVFRERWPRLGLIDGIEATDVYTRLGLTDYGLTTLAHRGAIIVSTDVELRDQIESTGGIALRFNQLRTPE